MRGFSSSTILRFVAELMVPDVSECYTTFKGKENLDPRREMILRNTAVRTSNVAKRNPIANVWCAKNFHQNSFSSCGHGTCKKVGQERVCTTNP